MPVPLRASREAVFAPGEGSKQRAGGADIVRDVNTAIGVEAIVAARTLPSGDIVLTFDKPESKATWEKRAEVAKELGPLAKARTKGYTLLVHGMRVAAIDVRQQARAIENIHTQNPRFQGKVDIVRLSWSRKTIKQGRRTAPLLLSVAEPEQANHLIEQGLLFGSELHDCEVFVGDCQVVQCFQCYSYGHVAKHCKAIVRCGFCAAAGHKTNDCPKKDDNRAHRCAVCPGGRNHTAWSKDCPVRQKKVEAARESYLNRPTKFQSRTIAAPTRIFNRQASPAVVASTQETVNVNFTQGTPVRFESVESDWMEVDAVRKKRKRGRPSTREVLQRPVRGTQDLRNAFSNTQNE